MLYLPFLTTVWWTFVYSLCFRLPRSWWWSKFWTRSLVVQPIYSVYTIYLINIMQNRTL